VKIFVAAVKAIRKKERQDETQFTTKIDRVLSFNPLLNANVFLDSFFLNLTPCMTKLRVLVLCFPYFTFTDNSNMLMTSQSPLSTPCSKRGLFQGGVEWTRMFP
jgi:hypothetical protein